MQTATRGHGVRGMMAERPPSVRLHGATISTRGLRLTAIGSHSNLENKVRLPESQFSGHRRC